MRLVTYTAWPLQQLQVLGKQLDVPVFEMGTGADPVDVAKRLWKTQKLENDVVIIDTAGRLHIDEELMQGL